jgi:hypothetical protein
MAEGATPDDGATAAGLQATPARPTIAAAKDILRVLFTDRALHADRVGRRYLVAAGWVPRPHPRKRRQDRCFRLV